MHLARKVHTVSILRYSTVTPTNDKGTDWSRRHTNMGHCPHGVVALLPCEACVNEEISAYYETLEPTIDFDSLDLDIDPPSPLGAWRRRKTRCANRRRVRKAEAVRRRNGGQSASPFIDPRTPVHQQPRLRNKPLTDRRNRRTEPEGRRPNERRYAKYW